MQINRHSVIEIRERSGMTKVDLAKAIGSSPGYIADIETGRRTPSQSVILRIADALKVPLPAILSDPERTSA